MDAHSGSMHDAKTPTRRTFLKFGGSLVAGGALTTLSGRSLAESADDADTATKAETPIITTTRTLGRTGFRVSDISLGCGQIQESNVIRYAYDHGINYFDVAETYGNGDSETKIGEAMPHLDRSRIFISTKMAVEPDTEKDTILERYGKCLERLKTDYADALYIHAVEDVTLIGHEAFHAAASQLKADGKLKHVGISSHGPRDEGGDSMEKVLGAAAEDGRFDLMLLSYNFLNREEAEKVLAACKEHNVGTTAMKTMPGYLVLDPFDPENPTGDYLEYIERMEEAGVPRETSIERIIAWLDRQKESAEAVKPFAEKHGATTNDELQARCIQWVLQNPDMHTVCVSMPDFEELDKVIPVSGTELSQAGRLFLEEYTNAYGASYCRHGCSTCLKLCPSNVPVSTIMRYSYYFARQGREKMAMAKYAKLDGCDARHCADCEAPCVSACPHGVIVPWQMMRAHSMLKLA